MHDIGIKLTACCLLGAALIVGCSEETPTDADTQEMGGEPALQEEAILVGGTLTCYSDKQGTNKVWTGKSAHNCCTKRNGKSWRCPSYNGGKLTSCAANKSYECK